MSASWTDRQALTRLVRSTGLAEVLEQLGCRRDRHDKAKWHTPAGIVSLTGPRFFNWTRGQGGGGAIDLVMQLQQWDFPTARQWLAARFATLGPPAPADGAVALAPTLRLPAKDETMLPRVVRYLTVDRGVPASLVHDLIGSGQLYADARGNAVFLLLGKEKAVVGAELRGTTPAKWHGLAPGSRKDRGCFFVGDRRDGRAFLCESAIDALSCFVLHGGLALSTAGATPDPPWLPALLEKGFQVACAFDADETGDELAAKMHQRHPAVSRFRPPAHDWNDALRATP
jgi:hypothetical protein